MRIRRCTFSLRSLSAITDIQPKYVFDTAGNGDLVSVPFTFSDGVTTVKFVPYGATYAAYEE